MLSARYTHARRVPYHQDQKSIQNKIKLFLTPRFELVFPAYTATLNIFSTQKDTLKESLYYNLFKSHLLMRLPLSHRAKVVIFFVITGSLKLSFRKKSMICSDKKFNCIVHFPVQSIFVIQSF